MNWTGPDLSRRTLVAIVLAALLVSGGAIAASYLFTAGAGTAYETSSGLVVSTSVDHGVEPGNPFNGTDSVTVNNVTFTASGQANVTADRFEGAWTNVSAVDATSNNITIDPADKPQATVGGSVTALSFRDSMSLEDDATAFEYSAGGSGTVTVNGLAANTDYVAAAPDGTMIDSGTTDGSGSATISVGSASDRSVILFTNTAPSVDDATADPSNNAELTTRDVTLSINVSDPDVATTQGDTISADFQVKAPGESSFSSVGTDSRSSNGTVTYDYTAADGGTYEWRVVVNDSYDSADVSSGTFSFQSPSTLSFRKELAPDQLVSTTDVKVTAYYSGEVERRNVSDGTLDLTDFPVDEPIIVRVNATGYYTRTAVIESIYDQNSVYMLNKSQESHLVRFNLQDLTGNYPESDTVLFVERDLERNGSVEWRTIAGDNFGVQGVPVHLAQDERYRLRIKNLETGTTTVVGSYTAIQSETVTLSTGGASISVPDSEREYSWAIAQDEDTQAIQFKYSDSANQTDAIKLTIHERFNSSNVLVNNTTFTDVNDLTYHESLTNDQANTTWMAEIYIDRGNGYNHFRAPIGSGPRAILPGGLDSVWVSGIGVFIVLIVGMAFSTLNQGVGAITTSLVGGVLWWFGVLDPVTAGPAVVLALAVSIVWHYRSNPGGVT